MYNILKRIFDFFASLFALLVLSPIFILIAIFIKVGSPGSVFFKQERIGIHKRHFLILKFRTMRSDAPKDVPTHLLSSAENYITKIGGFLRKTSLDEIPQLLNIIKGEMSVVGPRPALYNQNDLITERDIYGANDIPVGLTGWAQVNGRDELPIDVKAKLDGEYVRRKDLIFDLKIILLTIAGVFVSKGIVEGGTGAMENDPDKTEEILH